MVGVHRVVLVLELVLERGTRCMRLGNVLNNGFLLLFIQDTRKHRMMAGTDLISSKGIKQTSDQIL